MLKQNMFHLIILFCSSLMMHLYGMQDLYKSTDIIASDIDQLVLQGIEHIKQKGLLFSAKAGSGQQAYDVNYILTNPLNRVHNIRNPIAKRYFCKELLAYFKGSLNVNDCL